MDVFEDVTMKAILQAVDKLHELGETPSRIYIGRAEARRIVKQFNAIVTKGEDGQDYVWGIAIMPDDRIKRDEIYII